MQLGSLMVDDDLNCVVTVSGHRCVKECSNLKISEGRDWSACAQYEMSGTENDLFITSLFRYLKGLITASDWCKAAISD